MTFSPSDSTPEPLPIRYLAQKPSGGPWKFDDVHGDARVAADALASPRQAPKQQDFVEPGKFVLVGDRFAACPPGAGFHIDLLRRLAADEPDVHERALFGTYRATTAEVTYSIYARGGGADAPNRQVEDALRRWLAQNPDAAARGHACPDGRS